jgi:hypothetical protein
MEKEKHYSQDKQYGSSQAAQEQPSSTVATSTTQAQSSIAGAKQYGSIEPSCAAAPKQCGSTQAVHQEPSST